MCCWRWHLRVPWSARRSSQSNLKEISSEYLLEGLMLKLKLQYSGHMMQRTDSLEKTLMLGKIEGRRRSGRQKMWWFNGITDSMDMSLRKLREMVKDRKTWHAAVHGFAKNRTWLSNWTTTTISENKLEYWKLIFSTMSLSASQYLRFFSYFTSQMVNINRYNTHKQKLFGLFDNFFFFSFSFFFFFLILFYF